MNHILISVMMALMLIPNMTNLMLLPVLLDLQKLADQSRLDCRGMMVIFITGILLGVSLASLTLLIIGVITK